MQTDSKCDPSRQTYLDYCSPLRARPGACVVNVQKVASSQFVVGASLSSSWAVFWAYRSVMTVGAAKGAKRTISAQMGLRGFTKPAICDFCASK